MSASARPRWRCARRSSPPCPASRWRVLAPTTLLARQHFRVFSERFEGLPIRVAQLSRFVTAKDATEVKKGLADGPDRHRHRHPCAAGQGRPVQGSGPGHRRRGAAFRRRAQGAAEAAARRGPRADHDRDADPAHAAHGAGRDEGPVDHRDAAGRPAGGAHLRACRPIRWCCARRSCASTIAAGRASMSARGSRTRRSCRRICSKLVPELKIGVANGQHAGGRARGGDGRLLRPASSTCCSPPTSSRAGSTSRPPTR